MPKRNFKKPLQLLRFDSRIQISNSQVSALANQEEAQLRKRVATTSESPAKPVESVGAPASPPAGNNYLAYLLVFAFGIGVGYFMSG